MSRPRSHIPAPSLLVPALLRFAREHGADASLLALRAGLDPSAIDADELALAPATFGALLDDVADALRDPALPYRLARALPTRRYRYAEVAIADSATVGEAMQRFARFVGVIVPGFAGVFERNDAVCTIRLHTPGAPRGFGPAATEFALAYLLERLRNGAEVTLAPTDVSFAHPRPRDLSHCESFFATEQLSFGTADSGFSLTLEDAACAMARNDPRLLATVEPLAEEELRARAPEGGFERTVASTIESALPDVSIERTARTLAITPRTLQRRLEDEGTRYSDVVDRVREARARTMLLDRDRSSSDIAEALGFADLATFGRAFKRWTGISPGAFRRA